LFNPVVAGITAGGAFLISFVFGLFGRADLPLALMRALIFAGLFFGLAAGIYFLYEKFLQPEASPEKDNGQLGQNVDYSVGDNIEWSGDDNRTLGDMPILESGGETAPPVEGEYSRSMPADDSLSSNAGTNDTGVEELIPEDSYGTSNASGGVEQNDNNKYSESGGLALRENAAPFSGEGYSVNMNDFTPVTARSSESMEGKRSSAKDGASRRGTVDMSVERKLGKEDLGFEFDGKKIAGAIQTLLKKDEG
jgi:hypothetical protein